QSAGRQARAWVRFLHTGEALGGIGQTLAGIASLAAVLMVWTGLALSWRRLRMYLARARRQRQEALTAVTAVDH
ncbi:MAG: PepSY domain-containing protein, partial [Gammaproteobacteria bacterium]|nr:PepSY domain-containing protein [Gammaproteobacteria bacterium]